MRKSIAFCLLLLGCLDGGEPEGAVEEATGVDDTAPPSCATTCSCPPSPIIIDLSVGVPGTSTPTYNGYDLTSSVHFDIQGDGTHPLVHWTRGNVQGHNDDDAFLALDINGNGKIDSGRELFGTVTPQAVASGKLPNGFNALYMFDTNFNHIIDPGDAVWPSLLLWIDRNHNGISEPTELIKIDDYRPAGFPNDKIVSISLFYDNTSGFTDAQGNIHWFKSIVGWVHSGNSVVHDEFYNPYVWDVFLKDSTAPTAVVNKNGYCSGGSGGGSSGTGGGGGGSAGGGGGTGGGGGGQGVDNDNDVSGPFPGDSSAIIQSPTYVGIPGPWPSFGCAGDFYIKVKPGVWSQPVNEICSGTVSSYAPFTPYPANQNGTPGRDPSFTRSPYNPGVYAVRGLVTTAPVTLGAQNLVGWMTDFITINDETGRIERGVAPYGFVMRPHLYAYIEEMYGYGGTRIPGRGPSQSDLWKYCDRVDQSGALAPFFVNDYECQRGFGLTVSQSRNILHGKLSVGSLPPVFDPGPP